MTAFTESIVEAAAFTPLKAGDRGPASLVRLFECPDGWRPGQRKSLDPHWHTDWDDL